MKNLEMKFLWQILAILYLFSRGKGKKICKPGEVNYASQHFYVTARSKCKIFYSSYFELETFCVIVFARGTKNFFLAKMHVYRW